MTRLPLALLCFATVGCQTLSQPTPSSPDRPVSSTAPLRGVVDDAARLDQPSSEERFDALLALLAERRLPYEILRFPNDGSDNGGPAEGRNVAVTLGDGARQIVVGAHADAVRLEDGTLSHAMVDNAAGVVVLARVAETLRRYDLRHQVRVVFFDLEELGLLGSRHFAETLDPERVTAMLNLDIVGYGDTLVFGPSASEGNERVYTAVRQVCAAVGHQCLEFDRFPPSDDLSFQAVGIPNVSLATLPRAEAHRMWLVLNAGPGGSGLRDDFVPAILRTIHTPDDAVAMLDAEGMTLAYDVALNAVMHLDRTVP